MTKYAPLTLVLLMLVFMGLWLQADALAGWRDANDRVERCLAIQERRP